MNKAIFKYKKDDGTTSERIVLYPQMLKESSNYLKDFNNPGVNYLHGYEIDQKTTTLAELSKYEKLIEEYFQIQMPTLEAFLTSNGMDPKKVQKKTFKKGGIEDPKFL